MKLRYSCGAVGYTMLLNMNYPFPSIRTINRRMQHIEFSSGLIPEVFLALSQKVIVTKLLTVCINLTNLCK